MIARLRSEKAPTQVWTPSVNKIEDVLVTFKQLYNYQGGNRKIKIPSYKKQRAFYEVYKECTFKPQLNKKSLEMNVHKSFIEAPKKEEPGKIVKADPIRLQNSKSKSPLRNNLAGKIVSKSKVQEMMMNQSREYDRNHSKNEIHDRLYELHNLDRKKRQKYEAQRLANLK